MSDLKLRFRTCKAGHDKTKPHGIYWDNGWARCAVCVRLREAVKYQRRKKR